MELEINQQKHTLLPEPIGIDAVSMQLSLEKVMKQLYPEGSEGIAVALQGRVIARTDWAATFLKDADKLLILTATQGG